MRFLKPHRLLRDLSVHLALLSYTVFTHLMPWCVHQDKGVLLLQFLLSCNSNSEYERSKAHYFTAFSFLGRRLLLVLSESAAYHELTVSICLN